VVNQTLVFQIKFCGKSPALRVAADRYGDEKITQVLLKAKYLPEKRLYLASAIINKPVTEFRCYTLQQLTPTLFPY
jgi:hypothetical protein